MRDSGGGGKGRAGRVGEGVVKIGLMTGDSIPRTSIVIGHQVEEVEVRVHSVEVEDLKLGRAGGAGNGEEEAVAADGGAVDVESLLRVSCGQMGRAESGGLTALTCFRRSTKWPA